MFRMMDLPDFMVWMSFRYCLGRRSVAPGMWVDWAVKNWWKIGENDRIQIKKELNESFERDDRDRAKKREICELGSGCDRQTWDRMKAVFEKC
jgi:hypothetical protein